MFKLVVLSALLAVALAKPSLHAAYVAPAIQYIAAPAAVSHQSRVDIHKSHAIIAPVHAVAPAVHAVAPYHAVAAPIALGHHTPAVVLSPHGVPLETADVVAAKALHYQAHALASHGYHHYLKKRSLVTPLAYTAVVAPSAVSHQSRVDIHSTPLVHAYAAPVLSHYAASPIVSHYAAPYHGLLGHRAYGVHPW